MSLKKIIPIILFIFISPLAYSQEKEVVLKTTTGDISGTLLLPAKAETVVIIIAGSGPTDRDGNNVMGVHANSYQMLAKALSENNIASLRYDKRGIGKSAGSGGKEENLILDTFIKDVLDWASFLKKEYSFKKIVLAGHSEGALIASVAAQNKSVNATVLISGTGRKFDEVIAEQLKKNPNNPQFIIDQSKNIMDSLKAGHLVKNVPQYFMALYRPTVQPFLISTLKYSPVVEVKKITVPVLIVQGDADLQVGVADADLLSIANPKAKKVIIKDMNHTLKTVTDMADNQKAYTDPERPLAKELTPAIASFIQNL